MRKWLMAVVVACALVPPALAQEEAGAADRRLAPIEAQMAGVEEQIEELRARMGQAEGDQQLELLEQQTLGLQRELEGLMRQFEELRTFNNIQADSRARLQDATAELEGLEAEQEEEAPPAYEAFRMARLDHVRRAIETLKKIAALKGPAELTKAFALMGELSALDTEWDMVLLPTHEGNLRIAEMEQALAELGNPPELAALAEQARADHQQTVEDARALYDLWVAQMKRQEGFAKRVEEFWRRFGEQAASGAEQQPAPAD